MPGIDGKSASITNAKATINSNSGTPNVSVIMTGTEQDRGFEFIFDNIIGLNGKDAPLPKFNINQQGHLIVSIDGKNTDLGKVVGEGNFLPEDVNVNMF
jgi:hypothetical protein